MILVKYNKKGFVINHIWFFNEEEFKNTSVKADVAYIHAVDKLPENLKNNPNRVWVQNTLVKDYTLDGGGMRRLTKQQNMKLSVMRKRTTWK